MQRAFDCVILGGGPAGAQAALYTVRAGLSTLLFVKDGGALAKAHLVENYFGFGEPMAGQSLVEAGLENARRLGAEVRNAEALSLTMAADGSFLVSDGVETVAARAVLLATGKTFSAAPYQLDRFLGAGVSRCAVCDGFFFRGKPVGVLGDGAYALAEAKELLPLAASVTLFTDGKEPAFADRPAGLRIHTAKLLRAKTEADPLTNTERLTGLLDKTGADFSLSGLFLALGTPGASDFASRLGVLTENGHISADAHGQTNMPGVFAAGDCIGMPYQVSVAVGRGAAAGMAMVEFLRGKNKLYG